MTTKDSMETMERMLQVHGELHINVVEEEAELEVRKGTTDFFFEDGTIAVEGPDGYKRFFGMDSIVSWYKPTSIWHE